ncbi:conserved hypothetical protein [Ricinus communis]|uniref:Uncharacterized protein n=1 Tax=Ricinus communis TaxID=3988 RepID=B9RRJ9_RICCO|nr:conserved hypothetical protein [Ricinus communis]
MAIPLILLALGSLFVGYLAKVCASNRLKLLGFQFKIFNLGLDLVLKDPLEPNIWFSPDPLLTVMLGDVRKPPTDIQLDQEAFHPVVMPASNRISQRPRTKPWGSLLRISDL